MADSASDSRLGPSQDHATCPRCGAAIKKGARRCLNGHAVASELALARRAKIKAKSLVMAAVEEAVHVHGRGGGALRRFDADLHPKDREGRWRETFTQHSPSVPRATYDGGQPATYGEYVHPGTGHRVRVLSTDERTRVFRDTPADEAVPELPGAETHQWLESHGYSYDASKDREATAGEASYMGLEPDVGGVTPEQRATSERELERHRGYLEHAQARLADEKAFQREHPLGRGFVKPGRSSKSPEELDVIARRLHASDAVERENPEAHFTSWMEDAKRRGVEPQDAYAAFQRRAEITPERMEQVRHAANERRVRDRAGVLAVHREGIANHEAHIAHHEGILGITHAPEPPAPAEPAAERIPGATAIVGGKAGRWVKLNGKQTHIPHHEDFSREVGGVTFTSPAGSTHVFKNGEHFNGPRGVPGPAQAATTLPGPSVSPPAALGERPATVTPPAPVAPPVALVPDAPGDPALAVMEPKDIDKELARIWAAESVNHQRARGELASFDTRMRRMSASEPAAVQRTKDAHERKMAELKLSADALRVEAAPYEREYRRRPWARYYEVQNGNGHVHKSMHCSTCRRTTQFAWLTDLAAKPHSAMVEQFGEKACTTCFPDAPSMYAQMRAAGFVAHRQRASDAEASARRDAREERRRAQEAKAISNPDGSDLRIGVGRYPEHIRTLVTARNKLSDLGSLIKFAEKQIRIYRGEGIPPGSGWSGHAMQVDQYRADYERIIQAILAKTHEDEATLRAWAEAKSEIKYRRDWGA